MYPTLGSIIGRPHVTRQSSCEMPALHDIGSLFASPETNMMLPTRTARTIMKMGVATAGSRRYWTSTRSVTGRIRRYMTGNRSLKEFTISGYKPAAV